MFKILKKKKYFLDYRGKLSVACQIIRMHGASFPCDFFKSSLASVSPHSRPLRLSACRCVTHVSPLFIQTSPTLLNVSVAIVYESTAAFSYQSLKTLGKKHRMKIETGDQHRHLVARSRIALQRIKMPSRSLCLKLHEWKIFFFSLCIMTLSCSFFILSSLPCVVLWILITLLI